jgi:hypothetical protein
MVGRDGSHVSPLAIALVGVLLALVVGCSAIEAVRLTQYARGASGSCA